MPRKPRASGARPHAVRLALVGAFAVALTLAASAQAATGVQDAVRLKYGVAARSKPTYRAHTVARVRNYTPLSLSSAVLPVIGEATAGGTDWLRVRLPYRPNGSSGWIPARAAKRIELPYRIEVSISHRLVRLYRDGVVVRRFRVVVGSRSTPTPRGRFFVVERVRLHTSWAPGRWALAISAHSNVLRHFDGGDGQVALHARGFLGARLGSAASHGCVRFADSSIAWLSHTVGNGTPVDIVR